MCPLSIKNKNAILKRLLHIDIDLSKRIYGLDLLRALAILFVIFGHGLPLLENQINIRPISFLVLDGVSVFFVLSGFLIGQILIRQIIANGGGSRQLMQFWLRRWFRTLPNYFLILVVLSILGWYYWNVKLADMLPFIVFLQNFSSVHPPFFQEAWSLSVEEWFYILFPLSAFSLIKTEGALKKWLPLLIFGFVLLSITFRIYRWESLDAISFKDYDLLFRKQVITRFDSLMWGVFGAYLASFFPSQWMSQMKLKMWLGLSLILFNQVSFHFAHQIYGSVNFYHTVLSFTVFALGVFLCLPFLCSMNIGKGKIAKNVTLISLTSYSMYLIHFTLTKGFILPLTLRGSLAEHTLALDSLRVVLYLLITFIGSIILYKYFELPTTRLRDRFTKKQKTTPKGR